MGAGARVLRGVFFLMVAAMALVDNTIANAESNSASAAVRAGTAASQTRNCDE